MDARGQRPDGARCQVLPIYTCHDGHLSILLKPSTSTRRNGSTTCRVSPAHSARRRAVPPRHQGAGHGAGIRSAVGGRAAREQPHRHAGRTEFEDAPDPARRRHMLRLWLTIPNGRSLPPHYADTREYAQTYRQRMPA